MAWADNFNVIYKDELPIDDFKVWRFQLEEHKSKGTLHMNVRLFQKAKTEGGYEGPTKNGFLHRIDSPDDVKKFKEAFDKYFDAVAEKVSD